MRQRSGRAPRRPRPAARRPVPPGFARHDALVAAFAERLGRDWIPAAGLLALVGKLAVAGEAERLPVLEDELAGAFG